MKVWSKSVVKIGAYDIGPFELTDVHASNALQSAKPSSPVPLKGLGPAGRRKSGCRLQIRDSKQSLFHFEIYILCIISPLHEIHTQNSMCTEGRKARYSLNCVSIHQPGKMLHNFQKKVCMVFATKSIHTQLTPCKDDYAR